MHPNTSGSARFFWPKKTSSLVSSQLSSWLRESVFHYLLLATGEILPYLPCCKVMSCRYTYILAQFYIVVIAGGIDSLCFVHWCFSLTSILHTHFCVSVWSTSSLILGAIFSSIWLICHSLPFSCYWSFKLLLMFLLLKWHYYETLCIVSFFNL